MFEESTLNPQSYSDPDLIMAAIKHVSYSDNSFATVVTNSELKLLYIAEFGVYTSIVSPIGASKEAHDRMIDLSQGMQYIYVAYRWLIFLLSRSSQEQILTQDSAHKFLLNAKVAEMCAIGLTKLYKVLTCDIEEEMPSLCASTVGLFLKLHFWHLTMCWYLNRKDLLEQGVRQLYEVDQAIQKYMPNADRKQAYMQALLEDTGAPQQIKNIFIIFAKFDPADLEKYPQVFDANQCKPFSLKDYSAKLSLGIVPVNTNYKALQEELKAEHKNANQHVAVTLTPALDLHKAPLGYGQSDAKPDPKSNNSLHRPTASHTM